MFTMWETVNLINTTKIQDYNRALQNVSKKEVSNTGIHLNKYDVKLCWSSIWLKQCKCRDNRAIKDLIVKLWN